MVYKQNFLKLRNDMIKRNSNKHIQTTELTEKLNSRWNLEFCTVRES